jgi:hypothetical protein
MGPDKTKRKQKRAPQRTEKRVRTIEPPRSNGGAEDAAHFIAETLTSLARLARRHELDLLSYLLAMAQLEADEQVKLLRRRKLS